MHGIRLSPHISYCLAGGERIFLDLQADSYFRLDPEDEAVIASLESRDFVAASRCRPLLDQGLLTFGDGGRPVAPLSYQLPKASYAEQEEVPIRIGAAAVAEAAFDLLWARLAVWRGKFSPLNKIDKGCVGTFSQASLENALFSFAKARRFVPLATNCLRDSLACRSFLARRGIDADVVVGAKLHPFAAHCWVQRGEEVLNDNLSSATGFSPILIL